MILGARIDIVSRKPLTYDKLMRFSGGRGGEYDSPVDGEEHALFKLLKFL